ncbi:competence protein CoiA family protein [Streptomyces sp. R41]|uniref:Competence protein CoiA family protein n=1 Tax=Streptomyces sp. R41 TaxID=3238632 RepID=A0AB39RUF2_9ACTN
MLIHRARPRAPLRCPACAEPMHAKVSPRGLRFFAHDQLNPDCAHNGESIEHHLLKTELANHVRAAGWHAQLEVSGSGWRADVLATSPDGRRRIAWEAQLSSATGAELAERTERMTSENVEVCWVTDRRTRRLGTVPGIRVEWRDEVARVIEGHRKLVVPPRHPLLDEQIPVVGAASAVGHTTQPASDEMTFTEYVQAVRRAKAANTAIPSSRSSTQLATQLLIQPLAYWKTAEPILLASFVRAVLTGTVASARHGPSNDSLETLARRDARSVWTTQRYIEQARAIQARARTQAGLR